MRSPSRANAGALYVRVRRVTSLFPPHPPSFVFSLFPRMMSLHSHFCTMGLSRAPLPISGCSTLSLRASINNARIFNSTSRRGQSSGRLLSCSTPPQKRGVLSGEPPLFPSSIVRGEPPLFPSSGFVRCASLLVPPSTSPFVLLSGTQSALPRRGRHEYWIPAFLTRSRVVFYFVFGGLRYSRKSGYSSCSIMLLFTTKLSA